MNFRDIPQMTNANYRVNVPWDGLQDTLERYLEKFNLESDPDFQRAHVWNKEQQTAYVEFILRGGVSGRDIYFNQPGWMNTFYGQMVLVDGKQRVTAVLAFLNDELPAFGLHRSEFEGSLSFDCDFVFHINNLENVADIYQWYLDLNSGVAHTEEELEKVRQLLQRAENI